MPRARTILQSDFPYHIGARCTNREWFKVPIDYVWESLCEHLAEAQKKYDFKIHAFVLMSNHFHLIISTPHANLDKIMGWFMRETSRDLNMASGRMNQIWGGPYFRSVLGSHHYYLHAYKYLHANPLRAQIVTRVEDYRFSTLQALLGNFKPPFILEEDLTFNEDREGTLKWLNELPPPKDILAVRSGLRRAKFRLSKEKGVNHVLETDRL